MPDSAATLRDQAVQQAQGAMALQLAFIGVANGLFQALTEGPRRLEDLARAAGMDPDYVARWVDAAFAFGYLAEEGEAITLTETGRGYATNGP